MGETSGIGYETALALYTAGAHVILAGRDAIKAEQAASTIQAKGGKGTLEVGILDLASLRQINQFAESIRKKHDQLQILKQPCLAICPMLFIRQPSPDSVN